MHTTMIAEAGHDDEMDLSVTNQTFSRSCQKPSNGVVVSEKKETRTTLGTHVGPNLGVRLFGKA